MERYIPGFRVKEGETFQVPAARAKNGQIQTIDFMVNGVLLEYHPVRLKPRGYKKGGFQNIRELREYRKKLKSLPPGEARKKFTRETKEYLKEKYYQHRRALADKNPALRDKELLVVSSPEELYDQIITRFGSGPLPSREMFKAMFRALLKEPRDMSKRARARRKEKARRKERRRNRRNYKREVRKAA
ncbi:MAG: hypothetical protein D6719_04130 [Candidatus Dadabacteria bacterium]|nr:MAG: hypothetical protein D6719_04130 [Candidatus Dadabacteria bacterium]